MTQIALRCGVLTENCSWRIITSKASFAHTRAAEDIVSILLLVTVLQLFPDEVSIRTQARDRGHGLAQERDLGYEGLPIVDDESGDFLC
jgi:hypothetical protein